MKIPAKIFLFLFACYLGGCSVFEPKKETVLFQFDFANPEAHFAYGQFFGSDNSLHWFRSGWARRPENSGIWAIGPASEIQFQLLGSNFRVNLSASTSNDLARAGQAVTIAFNGRDLGCLDLPQGFQEFSLGVEIPDSVLAQGPNLITLTPARHRPQGDPSAEGDYRPLSFKIRELKVTGTLDQDQAEAWQALADGILSPAAWRLVTVPEPANGPKAQDQGPRPDLLVFLLDAARPDHFGCYGYDRDTTPAIDNLASAGLVFQNVFSTATYTRCAVPSLLTGHSWRDHRVIVAEMKGSPGDALADSFLTLPELLNTAGYSSFGYSGNPNFSTATNTHQGFDEFTEVWYKTDGQENTPELMADLFDQRLATGLKENPTLCYFHLVPPHEPYFPGPDHDLWPVPGHAPWVDGSKASLKRLDRGRCEFSEPDRDRLAALYDGNLHRVDAVVSRMVESWRNLGRDRPFIVIVLSDHGEGFGEHCRFGHNWTIYDEMTRIPLIVYPRSACEALVPAQDRLLAITDVMPLLLHLTGITPPPGSRWPLRFLQVAADPAAARSAVLVRAIRSVDHVGLRTDGYLALWDGWSRQELYDLRNDPGAAVNLRPTENDLYLGLMGSLNSLLEMNRNGIKPDEAELSEQDLRILKSLGYL